MKILDSIPEDVEIEKIFVVRSQGGAGSYGDVMIKALETYSQPSGFIDGYNDLATFQDQSKPETYWYPDLARFDKSGKIWGYDSQFLENFDLTYEDIQSVV